MMGGAVFVAAGQCVYNNRLVQGVVRASTALDLVTVLETGASEIRKAFAGEALDVVLSAYLDGLQVCFIFGAVVSGVAILIGFFAPIRSIKQGSTVTAAVA
jgi:hypothetical protein